jgi:hypothetical protein
MLILLKIYLAGMAVLIVAVVLNLLANLFHLATWYTFLNKVSELGFAAAVHSLKAVDILFLVLLYPFLLGLAAYLVFSRF